ncbi:MAG: GNAT family N-acetyltransferase [Waddliaceae bacterium]|nr:GNAT family N-acetyltransferase [Waddliaceae bacterium]MBT3578828.1 GNAT family N-acetyltransferase [Waddliaceae bacterium]MBT4445206.1 GNAT family N-acetyltransferase [Waddliaceae bacterium]MBT7264724.1 GNAT family N-acetyltransferase [Waddliaceae bacterium]MBT7461601.1 GNAT family N-acetyltransferase [Waddliaceae bacterium]
MKKLTTATALFMPIARIMDNSDIEYVIRTLSKEDLDDVMALHDVMLEALEEPSFFRKPSREFIEKIISEAEMSIGITVEEKLVACRITSIPGDITNNRGIELGIPVEDLKKTAHFEGTIIHPEYRKLGLGKKIIKANIAMIDNTDLRHIVATCHPDNYPIVKTFLDNDFVIKKLKKTYGNMLRFFMHRNRDANNTKEDNEKTIVDHIDYETQMKLLDDGLVGVGIEKTDNGYSIIYSEK